MNKTELIETIARRTDLTQRDVRAILDAFEDIAGDIVAKGGSALTIPGFLKFEQTHRAPRAARNPQTGETIVVPAVNAAKITPGARLQQRAKIGTGARKQNSEDSGEDDSKPDQSDPFARPDEPRASK